MLINDCLEIIRLIELQLLAKTFYESDMVMQRHADGTAQFLSASW